jgi:4-hydroxy-2-oxoheptanedioate aldolase
MRANWVREKMLAGQPTIGCFLGLGSPNVAGLLAHAGFDWLVIETEHNGLDSAEIEHMLMAMSGTATIPLVRVPSANPVFIQRALDMGALGIVVPMVRTAAEARAIVSASRYPPVGARSFGPLRASNYTFDNADYVLRANDNIIVALILETREAVEQLEEIASVPGVDAIFLGPFDLCFSLGLDPMQQPHPEIETIQEQMVAVARKTGIAAGMGANTPEQLRQRRAEGFTWLAYGPDYQLLADVARSGLAAFER